MAIDSRLRFFFLRKLSFRTHGLVSFGVECVEIAGAAVERLVVGLDRLFVAITVIRTEVGVVLPLELFGLVTHNTNNYKQDQL